MTVNAASGSDNDFAGNIVDSTSADHDSVALVLSGDGELTLSGTNAYSGGTTISGGTLNIAGDSSLGAAAGAVTFAGSGTLQAGADGILLNSGRPIDINSGVTGTIDTQGYNMTVAGVISGDGGLTKVRSGALTLTGANTYTGGATVIPWPVRLAFPRQAGRLARDQLGPICRRLRTRTVQIDFPCPPGDDP